MSATEYKPRAGSKAEHGYSALADGPMTLAALAQVMNVPQSAVTATMNECRKKGAAVSVVDEEGAVKMARVDRPLGAHRLRKAGSLAAPARDVARATAKAASERPAAAPTRPARRPAAPRHVEVDGRREWAAAAPVTADTGIAFGLYSDGDLLLARGEESFHLAAAETQALLGYLSTQRALLARVFGEGV